MPVSKAKLAANHRYDKKAYYMPSVRIPRSLEEAVMVKAKERGSVNGYIVDLIKKDLGITEEKK